MVLAFGEFLVVSYVLFFCAGVGLTAWWQWTVVLVPSFCHFLNLFAVPKVKLFDAVLEPERLRVVLVSLVLALKCANYAVEFCVFAK